LKNSLSSFDVVIVGFGPVGQFVSNLLNQYNLKIAIIEKSSGNSVCPGANVLDDKIMRFINKFDKLAEFKNKTSVPDFIEFTFPNGKTIQSNPVKKTLNGFPAVTTFYQPDLEHVLSKNIASSENIEIFYDNELIDFEDKGNQITLTTSSADKKNNKIIKSSFLLACDGSESLIRSKLKIDQLDLQYNKDWLVIDVVLNKGIILDKVARQICDPDRPTIFMHSPGGRHRFEFQLLAGEDLNQMKKESSVQSLLLKWLEPLQYKILRSEIYKFRGTKANQWRVGNIFLLGDAAHQVPPYAGQGINSGIRDAINIAWKLNLVANHLVEPNMLESYQIEREVHVEETIKSSIALGKLIDSLALAYKKKIPLADAVAPEARDQAYGGKKANPSSDINPGIYLNSLNHKFTGRLIPNINLKDSNGNEVSLDNLLNGQIAIIGEGNSESQLSLKSIKSLKDLNVKLIDTLNYIYTNSDFEEIIKTGYAIIRPDLHIFGVSDTENSIQDLTDQFFEMLCLRKNNLN
jgi:3-(3-hydroxy-phenyl)propionate hydroxylase